MFTIIEYYVFKNNISARLFFIYYRLNGKNNTENTEAKVRETVFLYSYIKPYIVRRSKGENQMQAFLLIFFPEKCF